MICVQAMRCPPNSSASPTEPELAQVPGRRLPASQDLPRRWTLRRGPIQLNPLLL